MKNSCSDPVKPVGLLVLMAAEAVCGIWGRGVLVFGADATDCAFYDGTPSHGNKRV
jgi:hypothetical protein